MQLHIEGAWPQPVPQPGLPNPIRAVLPKAGKLLEPRIFQCI